MSKLNEMTQELARTRDAYRALQSKYERERQQHEDTKRRLRIELARRIRRQGWELH